MILGVPYEQLKWREDEVDAREEAARKWHKQAVHDLEMAEKNLGIGGYDVAAFLAQQVVKKLLKAILMLQGKEVPRTHYLDQLSR